MKTDMNGFNMPKKLLMVAIVLILAVVCVFADTVSTKDELASAFDAGADKDIVLDSDFPIDESILLYSNNANLFLNCKSLTFKGEDACIDNSEGYRLDVYGGANASASSISGSLTNGAGNTITIWVNDSASVVNIHSGTIEGIGINSGILNVLGGYVSCICSGNTVLNKYINISGGYIDGIVERPNTLISISGGYFSSEPQSSWIAGGYCVVANTDAGTKDQYPYKVVPPSITLSSASSFSVSSSEKGWSGTIYYKLGDGAWTAWDGSSITSSQEGGAGDYKIQFRGKNNGGTVSYGKAWSITGSNVKVSGNIMSLVDYEDVANATMGSRCFWALFKNNSAIVDISELSLPSMTLSDLCYCEMFMGCTGLTNISSLSLPATTLKYQCYMKMFANCSKLVTVMSTLPATSLASQCYSNMFNGCSELTTPPSLSATILADSCYESMFAYCSKLTSPPVLNATDLKRGCYYEMFAACTSLTRLPVLSNVATVSGAYACYSMFRGCSKIVLCTDGTGENWTLPSSVTGTNASGWTNNMFGPSGISVDGTSLQTPTAGQNYYYKFNVSVSADSHGSVSTTSIANISEPKTVTVSNNTLIINSTTITATPDSGYVFDEWIGIPAGNKVVKNTSITAKFKALVTGVSLNKTTTSLGVGETETLTATVVPADAADKSVTWSSSNTSVATVNSTGLVTAVSGGSAIITVTTTDGGFEATCTVTVPHTHQFPAVGGGEVTFETPISSAAELNTLFSNGGSGYLAADITLTSNVIVGVSKTVKFCLNGHVLTMGSSYIRVDSNANLAIYDCGTTEHKFTVDSSTGLYTLDDVNGTVSLSGGVVTGGTSTAILLNGNGCNVTVFGGNFVGNKREVSSLGGAVFSMKANTLTINGGYYAGNYTTGMGAVIYTLLSGGEIHINGGVFANNKAARDGGAISSSSPLYITGGEIKNNTATYTGGAVRVTGCSITMTGGKITGNTSAVGAGLYMDSGDYPINITGGEISGNTITNTSGACGVTIRNNDSVIGGSAKIYGNTTADGVIRNVFVYSGTTFSLVSPSEDFHTSISYSSEYDNEINITSTSATTTFDYSEYFDAENPNYYIASAENETSGNHGVLKKYLTFSPYVTNVTKTYDGSSYGIAVNPRVDGATVKYGTVAGTYNLSVSPTYSNVGFNIVNYQITKDGYKPYSGSGTVTINAATMTVSGSNYNAAYDGLPHGTAATPSVVAGTTVEYSTSDGGGSTWSAWSTTVPQRKDVGTTNVKVKTTNSNYNEAQGNYTLTVTPKAVTVTSDNKSKTYGSADPAFTVTVSGLVSDDTIIYDTPTRAAGENVGEYVITPSGTAAQGNYAVTYVASGKLTINPALMTVSGKSYNVTYDGLMHGDAATASIVAGTTVEYSTDGGSNWSTTVPQRKDIGTTTVMVRATNANYVTAEDSYTLTVTRKAVTVISDNKSKTFGAAEPVYTATVTGTIGTDTVSYTCTRESGDDIGEYTITPSGAAEQGNYSVTYKADGKLTINPVGTLTVSVNNYSGIYDGQSHGTAATASVETGTTVEYSTYEGSSWSTWSTTVPQRTDVGTTNVKVKATNSNYVTAESSYTITITAKAVTVTSENKSKTYDDADPALTATVAGLVGSDTVDYTVTRATGENVGTYTITPSGDAVQGNYSVSYVASGKLTINAKSTLTVSGSSYNEVYDGQLHGDAVTVSVVEGTTVEYSTDNGSTWYTVVPQRKDIGTTTVKVRATNANYVTAESSYALTVTAKAVTVTSDNKSKLYGFADPELTATVTGLVGSDTVGYTVTRVSGSGVGNYTITPSGDAAQGNYTVAYVASGKLTINPATTMTVSVSNYSGTYDGQSHGDAATVIVPDGTAATVEYSTDNGTNWSTTVPTIKDVGTTTVKVKATNANYVTAESSYTLTVTRKAVTVTSDNKSKTYGAAEPVYTATVTGTIGTDTVIYTCTREAGDDIGEYTITPSGAAEQGNYTVTYVASGKLTVTRKAVTVTSDNKSKTYDDADPALTATVNGTIGSDNVSYTLSREVGESVGNYTITPSGAAVQGNYTVTYVASGKLTIKAKSTLTVSGSSYNEVYDGQLHGDAAAVSVVDGTTVEYSTDNGSTWYTVVPQRKDVGTTTVKVRATNANYVPAESSYALTVTAKAVTVTSDNKSKAYGVVDPELTATVTGLVGSDTVGYTVTRVSGSNVGDYTITPSGDAAQGNYTVTYVAAGKLTINPATTMTVSVSNYSGTYDGQSHGDAATASVTEGTTVEYSTDNGANWSTTVPQIKVVGTTNVKVKATNSNYVTAEDSYILTVTRKAVTVTSDNKSKAYGTTDPEFTATVAGTVGTETVSYSVAREAGENIGEYTITPSGAAEQGNYTVTYVASGKLKIDLVTMTVTGTNYNGVYDGEYHGDAATVTITAGTAVEYSTDGGSTWSTTVPQRKDVGTTNVKVRATNPNYVTDADSYTLTVTAKAVTVTSVDKSKTYDDADPALTATVNGTIGSDNVSYTLSREVGESVGNYTITPSGAAVQGNYYVTYVAAGKLTIGPKAVASVSLNKTTTAISLGGDETLTSTVSPDNATDKSVIWTSSNAAVATVDQNGKVSAVGLGNATITVTTTDGSMTASCTVTVKEHVHVWHYSTSAAGFIAECTGTGTCDKNNIMTLGVGVGITIQ